MSNSSRPISRGGLKWSSGVVAVSGANEACTRLFHSHFHNTSHFRKWINVSDTPSGRLHVGNAILFIMRYLSRVARRGISLWSRCSHARNFVPAGRKFARARCTSRGGIIVRCFQPSYIKGPLKRTEMMWATDSNHARRIVGHAFQTVFSYHTQGESGNATKKYLNDPRLSHTHTRSLALYAWRG